ncbi:hypothetical protein FHJ30_04625 [Arthrobacter sp. BB-1]|uniref:prealbumin-like fold domain-containing protein n=1 Tax=Micrococcaceae TaxID=1268 RepID=UPI0011127D6B|nr:MULTISPECIES: prealbumin-like fold domain-containing protein [Micrococcaceae]TNB74887.1 hypothetical protein FHJ30_04625 [Arthrobacter sp. BB-1]UEL29286.1 prealbumin-like fold domain-containing protein [Pseudarthrobacter sp. L1SW]
MVVDTGDIKDWANIGISCEVPVAGCGLDKATGQTDDSFGTGTKEDTAVPSVVDGSIPNNKSDLTRFYAKFVEESNGKTYAYLAWERVQEPSGTTNMDFEFNQSSVLSSNGVTPVRTAGDVLIKYDLSQGGVTPVLGFHRWITTGARTLCEAANATPCWSKVQPLAGNFEGSINTVVVTDPIAPNAPRDLSVRTFGEAAINLTDAKIVGTDPCLPFSSAYLKSRSSDSFTAALKDFIAPISVATSKCADINILKTDDDSPASALAGAVFTLYNDAAPVGGTFDPATDTAVTPATTCTTGADGKCSFSQVLQGNYWVVETTTPTGHDTAAPQAVTVVGGTNVSLTFVNPRDFKIIVLVCKEADNSLYSSQVTVDGVNKDSLATAPSGTTAAQLCSLGGAAYDDKSYGAHPANVDIPQ